MVATMICQTLFGLVGLLINYHFSAFLNFVLVGILGSIPGFILGTVWHFSGDEDRRDTIALVCYGGFLAVALTVLELVFIFPAIRSEVRGLAHMSQLRQETIRRIDVMDQYGEKCLRTVTEPEILAAFAEACSDAEGWSPSRPKYTHSWNLVVVGTDRYEVDLNFGPRFPGRVVGDFIVRSDGAMRYHCPFESRQLRAWVEKHLLPRTRSRRP